MTMPFELLEAMVIEKTGWTFDQLDEQESGRVLRMVSALSTRDKIQAEYQRLQANRASVKGR